MHFNEHQIKFDVQKVYKKGSLKTINKSNGGGNKKE